MPKNYPPTPDLFEWAESQKAEEVREIPEHLQADESGLQRWLGNMSFHDLQLAKAQGQAAGVVVSSLSWSQRAARRAALLKVWPARALWREEPGEVVPLRRVG